MTERNFGAVFSDVDGTQIKPNVGGMPSEAVQEAARGLRANSIMLVEATSRPHALMGKLIEPLDLRDNLCILDGGATIAHADSGEVVASKWLTGPTKREVIGALGSLCSVIRFDTESRKKSVEQVVAEMQRDDHKAQEPTPSIFAVFPTERSDDVVAALGGIADISPTDVMFYDKDPVDSRCIQVVSQGVDKRHGVDIVTRRAGLQGMRRVFIGDGTNDKPLLASAGPEDVRVVLDNDSTPDSLRQMADLIVPSVENDGFSFAMRHLGLIK